MYLLNKSKLLSACISQCLNNSLIFANKTIKYTKTNHLYKCNNLHTLILTQARNIVGTAICLSMPSAYFKCSVCSKAFRIESALMHHIKTKHAGEGHAIKMESVANSSEATPESRTVKSNDPSLINQMSKNSKFSTFLANSIKGAATPAKVEESISATNKENANKCSMVPGASSLGQTPYHIAVAPHAPAECELAVHSLCVNQITIVGEVISVTSGYALNSPALQISLATGSEEIHTIRCMGDKWFNSYNQRSAAESDSLDIYKIPNNGDRVCVLGQLKLIPQYEHSTKKYYHFPIICIMENNGFITKLD